MVKAAIRVATACTARITGTEGWIGLPAFMHCPDHVLAVSTWTGSHPERIDCGWAGEGLRFQAAEVASCGTVARRAP